MAATITFVEASSIGGTGRSTVTLDKPTGTADGDLMVAVVNFYSDQTPVTLPSGWTSIGTFTDAAAGGNPTYQVVSWKIAGASEPSSYDFVLSGSDYSSGGIITLRPVSGYDWPANPIESSQSWGAQDDGNPVQQPGATVSASFGFGLGLCTGYDGFTPGDNTITDWTLVETNDSNWLGFFTRGFDGAGTYSSVSHGESDTFSSVATTIVVYANAVSSGITGSGAPSLAAATPSASGTFTPPPVSGSGTPSLADATSSASGTHTGPSVSGSASPNLADATSSGAGTHTVPTFSASGTPTLAGHDSTASGTFVPPPVSGSGAVTLEATTSSGTGFTGTPTFTGSGSPTLQDSSSTGAGSYAAPDSTGSAAVSLSPASSAGSGTHTGPVSAGTSTAVLADATSTGAGTFSTTGPSFTGSAAVELELFNDGQGTYTLPAPSGTASPSLDDTTATGSGTANPPVFTGASDNWLEPMEPSATGVGTRSVFGAGDVELDDTTPAGTGTFQPPGATGSAAVTLDDLSGLADGVNSPASGSGSETLDDATASGAGVFYIAPITGYGSAVIDDLTGGPDRSEDLTRLKVMTGRQPSRRPEVSRLAALTRGV